MRSGALDICKGIAIILMVIGHTEYPGLLNFVYEFHMPIFFIAAGYCFSLSALNNEATFVKKRLKGLYWPFLKWSVIFLCLHNLMFEIGILNEQFGNAAGGVTHPYTWHQFQQRIWSCVFNMSGYDEFLTGAFWFFRALLLASIAYLALFKLLLHVKPLHQRTLPIAWTIAAIALLMALWQTGEGLVMTGVVQGGYRDLMGLFFFAIGFIFQQNKKWMQMPWWGALLCLSFVIAASIWFPSCLTYKSTLIKCVKIVLPAIAGFAMTYWLSSKIEKWNNPVQRFLLFCGRNTLSVYVFHIICFKIVSALKISYYGLDWGHIGDHMIVHHNKTDLFWILYTIAGVGIPLLCTWGWEKFKETRVSKDRLLGPRP